MTEIDKATKKKAQEEGIPETIPMVIYERNKDGTSNIFNFQTRNFEPIEDDEEEDMETSIAINRAMDKFFEKHGLKNGTLQEQIDKKALFILEKYPEQYSETVILEKIDELLTAIIWNKGVADIEKVVKGNQTEAIADVYLKEMLLDTLRPEPEPKPRKYNGSKTNGLASRLREAFELMLYFQNPQAFKIYQTIEKQFKDYKQARQQEEKYNKTKSILENVLGHRRNL